MQKDISTLSGKENDYYKSEFASSGLAYNCELDVFASYNSFKGTTIIATLGPACSDQEMIKDMIRAGMKIARFNFSHGDHAYHKSLMDKVRTASDELEKSHPVALALDTKGPEIRTGINKDGATITVNKGDKIILTTSDDFKESSTSEKLYLDYKALAKSIKVGQIILIADGTLVLEAESINDPEVTCKIISGCSFGSRKNACLPGVKVDLPALSAKDVEDIKFGMEQKVDMIFASFIRSVDNVRELRALLDTTEHGKKIKIVSKIENFEGVNNIEKIIEVSDGIMVARGDLGMDLSIERVIIAQKKILALCNLRNVPAICATQMLESMITNFRPTRAEASDVTNAVHDGADCVMLSGESANGKYPIQAIKTMYDICVAAEKSIHLRKKFQEITSSHISLTDDQAICLAAVSASYKMRATIIFTLSSSGRTGQFLSQFHPRCPIFLLTRDRVVASQSHLYRNVFPLHISDPRHKIWLDDVELRFRFGVKYAMEKGFCKFGDKAIFICGWKSGPGLSNSLRIITLEENYVLRGL